MNEVKTSEEGNSSGESTDTVNSADDEKQKSFREQAIEAYKKDNARQEKIKKENADAFRRKAQKAFFELFDIATTASTAMDSHKAIVYVADQKFVAQKEQYGSCIFYTIVKCTQCEKELVSSNPVAELWEIGRILSKEYVCNKCKEKERKEELVFQSTAELVLEKVREIYNLVREE